MLIHKLGHCFLVNRPPLGVPAGNFHTMESRTRALRRRSFPIVTLLSSIGLSWALRTSSLDQLHRL